MRKILLGLMISTLSLVSQAQNMEIFNAATQIHNKNWEEVSQKIKEACEKNGYTVKYVVNEKHETLCVRKDDSYYPGQIVERNMKISALETPTGFGMDAKQWLEKEEGGKMKKHKINQRLNFEEAFKVLEDISPLSNRIR